MSPSEEELEILAAKIGETVYIEVAKWHLYLNDAHLHTVVAEALYPRLLEGRIDLQVIDQVFQEISVQLGAGKRTLPLADLVPKQCQKQLLDVLEEFE